MKWFENMKISKKLLGGFLMVALMVALVGVIGILNIGAINKAGTDLYEKNTLGVQYAGKINGEFQKARVTARELVLKTGEANWQKNSGDVQNQIKELSLNLDKYKATLESEEEGVVYESLRVDVESYFAAVEKVAVLTKENKFDEAKATMYSDSVAAITKKVSEEINQLFNMKVENAKQKSDKNNKTAYSSTVIAVSIGIFAILFSIALGIIISRNISRPVNKLVNLAEKVADGDLNVNIDIDSKDEVGTLSEAFRKMTDNLNDVMSNIGIASDQVATGSRQMSDSSMALSQGATEQASSIQELTASLEEISSQTRINADNAKEANLLSERAKDFAVKGNEQMGEMLKAMDEINESSGKINKIIKVIDEIAFQTNILALNAAVEAARAGQHGKGFAVVAEEVRNLAARSAEAAKETTDMIEGSIMKVEGGTRIANETAKALNEIVEGIAKVSDIIGNIAIASNEQASGITQINQGIIQVSQVVQTNSATSEESAAASEELASQADLLKHQISRFRLKNVAVHKKYNDIDPDILQLIDQMNERKKSSPRNNTTGNIKSESNASKKIPLDSGYGKY